MVRTNERKLEEAVTNFEVKNQRFRELSELPIEIYKQLENHGIDIKSSFLLDWFPEGTSVYTVKLLLPSGACGSFLVATDDADSFLHKDATEWFKDKVRKSKQKKWTTEVIAWEAFLTEKGEDK